MRMSKIIFSIIVGTLGALFGEFDMLLITLTLFVVMDYLTGIMKAIISKNISSSVGFKGIFKKILIFFMVGVAVRIDMLLGIDELRYLVLVFYIINEGISIIENAGTIGLPIPDKIKSVLNELKNKEEKKEDN